MRRETAKRKTEMLDSYLQRVADYGESDHEAMMMAIKALEQEPVYYPPCIDCNKKMDEIRKAYDNMTTKALEQEPILDKPHIVGDYYDGFKNGLRTAEWRYDKLRAEIENINVWGMRYNPDTYLDQKPQIVQKVKEHIIEIIDKYKAESEVEE